MNGVLKTSVCITVPVLRADLSLWNPAVWPPSSQEVLFVSVVHEAMMLFPTSGWHWEASLCCWTCFYVLSSCAFVGRFELRELSCTLRSSSQSDIDPTREFLHMGLWLSSSWNVLTSQNAPRLMFSSGCSQPGSWESSLVHPSISISMCSEEFLSAFLQVHNSPVMGIKHPECSQTPYRHLKLSKLKPTPVFESWELVFSLVESCQSIGCWRKSDVHHCGVMKSQEKGCSVPVGERRGSFVT